MEAVMLNKTYVKSRKVSKVTFQLGLAEIPESINAESVNLVGEFNDWDVAATPMTYSKKQKAYRVTLDLEPGQSYQFRYLVNGEHWCNDWAADAYVPTSLGQDNCLVVAPAEPAE
jgi:1,4-alpha-glucan branching enzyme